ncbi:efflux transporter outer membrane subunit [Verrucomicrobiaceae bacterium N1E253]|uniref:Efflux transporter outer membrane subunit n=1 Tax=Oceaniferula marina TaxID=2748318 RepID=A0A851GKY5_9BACT|nr:efflux transporter outer membrane subunit [Oceaniferula marina]NWK55835.1 efflux transporter outer membrane subunit [Oceaniferula marina]
MKYSPILLAALPVMLGSCMVGPNYSEPVSDLEAAWNEYDASLAKGPGAKVNMAWWTQFNDPTLNQLVESAYKQNLGLRTAALRILESRALLGITHGNMFPQSQTLGGDLYRTRQSGNPPANQYVTSATFGFDAAWELDFWGKFRRSIESADASLMADVADYDDVLVTLTAEVANTYVNIRTLEERIRLAYQNEKLQKDSLKLVELQFEAGTVTELDVLQAKTLLTTTQAQIPNFQSSLIQFQNALSVLLGESPGGLRDTLKKSKGIPQAPVKVAVGLPAELLRRRPDIRRAEMTAIAQSSQIGVAKADLYPSFTLIGSLGTSSSNAGTADLDDIFNIENYGFTFGPAFRWNILNYGRIKNNVRVQDARFEQTITVYQNTVLNAAREVEDGMTGFVQAKKEAAYVRQGVATSKKSSELSMLQYKEGLADYQRVLDSIRSLTQKQDQYAAIQGSIATNLISMYKALGGGWEIRDRTQAIPGDVKEKMKNRTNWGKMLDDQAPRVEGAKASDNE